MEKFWYQKAGFLNLLLLPLSFLYAAIAQCRRFWLTQIKPSPALSVPVIVVGNISVGGTGKTPTVIAVVEKLRQIGLKPGVISRGYGGRYQGLHRVDSHDEASLVGDEPKLIHARTQVPLVLCRDRYRAAKALEGEVDVIVSDDGMQHYALPRDVEICVVDGSRGFGNGLLLPAGPLREPKSRAKTTLLLINGADNHQLTDETSAKMTLQPEAPVRLSLSGELPENAIVNAFAGIGNPERFKQTLLAQGFVVNQFMPLEDHAQISRADIAPLLDQNLPIIMTEKDAVKCAPLLREHNAWYLPIRAEIEPHFFQKIEKKLEELS